MAVVYVREDWEGRSGTRGAFGENTSTRVFFVKTDSRFDSDQDVANSDLLPTPFISTHPDSPAQLCRTVTPENLDEDPHYWNVTVEYSDEPLREGVNDQPDPLLRPVDISWGSVQYQKPIFQDINGNVICNTANDPFDPPPVIDDARWTITIQQNVPAVPTFILNMNNTINSGPVIIDSVSFPARTLKVQSIGISPEQFENNILYRTFICQLHYREETWQYRLLNAGFADLAFGVRGEILLDDGSKPSQPWPLDEQGLKIQDPSPETIVVLNFDVYHEADFSVLPGVF